MEAATASEAQALIDANGGVVVGKGVQDRRLATLADFVDCGGDENARIAAAARVGMRADGADLDVLRKVEALAGHGDEPAGVEDAEEGSQLVGAVAKWAGLGEFGQVEHGGNVGGCE